MVFGALFCWQEKCICKELLSNRFMKKVILLKSACKFQFFSFLIVQLKKSTFIAHFQALTIWKIRLLKVDQAMHPESVESFKIWARECSLYSSEAATSAAKMVEGEETLNILTKVMLHGARSASAFYKELACFCMPSCFSPLPWAASPLPRGLNVHKGNFQ